MKMAHLFFEAFKGVNNQMSAAEIDELTQRTVGVAESDMIVTLSEKETDLLSQVREIVLAITLNTEDAKRYSMYTEYTVNAKLITDFIYEGSL